jgi:hypothetical protein
MPRSVTPQTAPKQLPQRTAHTQPAAPAPKGPERIVAAPVAPPPKKPSVSLALSSTLSTSRADMETLEQVIELVRNKKQSDATQLEASITDPVARKLAEWMILRSDNNGAPMERYRAFLTENPTWRQSSPFSVETSQHFPKAVSCWRAHCSPVVTGIVRNAIYAKRGATISSDQTPKKLLSRSLDHC